MRLNHLSLTNFRNYSRLELAVPDRLTVIQGANAQGKTNLLEAIHLLATGRSPRAGAERELINWLAFEGPLPYARLWGEVATATGLEKLEMVLELNANGGSNGPVVRKQVRIDGVARRTIELVGRLRMVLFLPEDVSLVAGAPAERRRYLDIALCQISAPYCRTLSSYNQIVAQRNALLRHLNQRGGDPGQLNYWDVQMAELGSLLLQRRSQAVADLDRLAAEHHLGLSGGSERLRLAYLPSPDPHLTSALSPMAAKALRLAESRTIDRTPTRETFQEHFLARLRALRSQEIAAGACLIGPHRDDIAFAVDGRDLRAFGSRGQQRTATLALKLAEVQMMREATGDGPLLLLDDVMSELDATRRQMLLAALSSVEQAIITTTDLEDFSAELVRQARVLRLEKGTLIQAA